MNMDEFRNFDKHCVALQVTTLTENSENAKDSGRGRGSREVHEKHLEFSAGTKKVSRCGEQHTTKGRKTDTSLLPSLFMPES